MAEGKRPRSPSLGLQVGKKGQWDGDFINPVGSAGALEAVDGGGHGLLSSLLVQRPATGFSKATWLSPFSSPFLAKGQTPLDGGRSPSGCAFRSALISRCQTVPLPHPAHVIAQVVSAAEDQDLDALSDHYRPDMGLLVAPAVIPAPVAGSLVRF